MADHVHTTSIRKIRAAFFINLAFSIIELVGGLYTNSVAILSDALHDLGDSLSLGAAWYFQKVSQKGRDEKFSYGYRRFSVLGAIVNSIVLVIGSVFILTEALPRLLQPETPHAAGMIYLAIGGILANGFAAWRLHGGQSLNERAVYLHLLEDVLGWVATLIAGIVIHFYALPILDPLLAMGIAAFILFNVGKNLRRALLIILQGTPTEVDTVRIGNQLQAIPGVKGTHDCHSWSLDGQYHILSIHLVVGNSTSMQEAAAIKSKAKQILKKEHIDHATIEIETEAEDCVAC